MAYNIIDEIRKRSRESYLQEARERFTDLRIWIQEHSEQAAILSLVVGMLVVVLFKFFITLFLLAVLAAISVYYIAFPEEHFSRDRTQNGKGAEGEELEGGE